MTYTYATLEQIRYLWEATYSDPATQAELTNEEIRLMQLARAFTDEIDEIYTYDTFMPQIATKYFNIYDPKFISRDGHTLTLYYPLSEITTVTLADTTVLTVGTDVIAHPRNSQPYWELVIPRQSNFSWFTTGSSGGTDEIEIAGVWCWRNRYDSRAWLLSGDTVLDVGGIDDSVTAITVASVIGATPLGVTPRFSVGQVIRIEDEYMTIISLYEDDTTVTVERAINGSTAVAHAQTTVIEIFSVEPAIVDATALATEYRYFRIGKHQQVTVNGQTGNTDSFPTDIPDRAKNLLSNYKLQKFGVV